jgi:hypothetical protein
MTWGSEFPTVAIATLPASVVLIVDQDAPPDVALLKAAKAAGVRVAFNSGGSSGMSESRLKARLQAIRDAGLGWKDFWVPGKP